MSTRVQKFSDFNPVNESVQAAKEFLIKNLKEKKRKEKKISPTEKVKLTTEEEKKALQDPKYTQIRDYILNVVKKPGLVYPFTYFSIAEDLPFKSNDWRSIENILKMYIDASKNFSFFPLPKGNIEAYTKLGNNVPQPGHEILYHDLENILENKELKEFIDKLRAPSVREEFKNIVNNLEKDPIKTAVFGKLKTAFNNLKKIKKDNEEKGEKDNPMDTIISLSPKYKEIPSSWAAFKKFVNDCNDRASAWGTPIGEFIEKMNSIEPKIKVLYTDVPNGIVVTSARTADGLTEVCNVSDSKLCILGPHFYDYTEGCLQVNITNFNLDVSDQKNMTTMTIRPNGTLKEAKTKYNHTPPYPDLTPYGNYKRLINEYLPELNTEEIIKSIEDSMNSEFFIKDMVAEIISDNKKPPNMKKPLTREEKFKNILWKLGGLGLKYLGMTEENIEIYHNLFIEIILREFDITYDIIIDHFLDEGRGGFWTMEDINLFITLTENNYRKEDIKKIYDLTEYITEMLPKSIAQIEPGPSKDTLKQILEIHPEIKSYMEANML
jgi:hypothetical protein